jgi:hypothetical protein
MVTIDMASRVSAAQTLAPSAASSDQTGDTVDLAGFDSAAVLIDVGAHTDGTHDFTVEESDDDSTWSDVASDDLIGSTPTIDGASGNANQTHEVGYVGSSRYLRVSTSTSGTTDGAVYGATVVRGAARKQPV